MKQSSSVFRIQDKEFHATPYDATLEEFDVRSVPRPYRVTWESDSAPMASVQKLLDQNPRNVLLIDGTVQDLYRAGLSVDESRVFRAEATEDFKTLAGVTRVIEFLQKNAITKGETLVVVGGGIIQDVGAFVGACFKRGIPWVYYPTTLLSMCDSCIGGKTGINHGAKNQVALFSAPTQVVINPQFLKTLGPDEVRSGLGEILKLCVTGGPDWVDRFRRNVKDGLPSGPNALKELVFCGLLVKKAVVEEDEFELDHRRSLNYGHTVGHAVEALSNYEIPHGEAVSIGMIVVNELSTRRGFLSASENDAIKALALSTLTDRVRERLKTLDARPILSLLQKDKKTLSGTVHFVFIRTAGNTFFHKTELNDALATEVNEILRSLR